jgi:cell division protein FtsB
MENIIPIVIVIFGVFILFLIIRELVLWYWRINESIATQKKTNELLEEQNNLIKQNNSIMKQFVDDFTNK